MFENFKTYEFELAGRRLVIETGKMAGLANGSCLVRYGDTAVLCSATASARPRPGIDFYRFLLILRNASILWDIFPEATTAEREDLRTRLYGIPCY